MRSASNTAPAINDGDALSDPSGQAAGSAADTILRKPLFHLDPGWLFVLCGLAVCAAGVMLPAQADLHALRQQLDGLKTEESRWYARLKAHSDFVDQVDRADPDVVRRLAASQLNMIPTSETPVLLASANPPPVTHWIDGTVKVDPSPIKPLPVSTLSQLANGPDRLWLFAGGIMCVFIGLVLGPNDARQRRSALNESTAVSGEEAARELPHKRPSQNGGTAVPAVRNRGTGGTPMPLVLSSEIDSKQSTPLRRERFVAGETQSSDDRDAGDDETINQRELACDVVHAPPTPIEQRGKSLAVLDNSADGRRVSPTAPRGSQTQSIKVVDDVGNDQLLTADHVQSNVLVEVPPASRTMEAKVVAPTALDLDEDDQAPDAANNDRSVSTPAPPNSPDQIADSKKKNPNRKNRRRSCLIIDSADESGTSDASENSNDHAGAHDEPIRHGEAENSADHREDESNDEAALAESTSSESEWPLTPPGSDRSNNRFQDGDASQDRSAFE